MDSKAGHRPGIFILGKCDKDIHRVEEKKDIWDREVEGQIIGKLPDLGSHLANVSIAEHHQWNKLMTLGLQGSGFLPQCMLHEAPLLKNQWEVFWEHWTNRPCCCHKRFLAMPPNFLMNLIRAGSWEWPQSFVPCILYFYWNGHLYKWERGMRRKEKDGMKGSLTLSADLAAVFVQLWVKIRNPLWELEVFNQQLKLLLQAILRLNWVCFNRGLEGTSGGRSGLNLSLLFHCLIFLRQSLICDPDWSQIQSLPFVS